MGRWKCSNETRCIEKRYVCDGNEGRMSTVGWQHKECIDGSDEGAQLCKESFCEVRLNRWKCPNEPKCVFSKNSSCFDCYLGGSVELCTEEFCNRPPKPFDSYCAASKLEEKHCFFKCPNRARCLKKTPCTGLVTDTCTNNWPYGEWKLVKGIYWDGIKSAEPLENEMCTEEFCSSHGWWKCSNRTEYCTSENRYECKGKEDCCDFRWGR